jgi:hypothetical protein
MLVPEAAIQARYKIAFVTRLPEPRARPEQPSVLDLGYSHPGVDSLFHPDWHRNGPNPSVFAAVALHSIPGITLACFQSFSGIWLRYHCTEIPDCLHKIQTKFLLKFVRDRYKHKADTIFFPASVSVRQLSTTARRIPGFKCG